jgi:hypothetical protein
VAHRLRDVEVVVHGPGELSRRGGGPLPDLLAAPAVCQAPHPVAELAEPRHRLVGGAQGVLVPVQGAAIVGTCDQQVADRRGPVAGGEQVGEGPEVAQTLGHLLPVHGQVLGVAPDPDEAPPGRRLRLGDLVLVVGEDVVDPTAVDVQALPQQGHAHRRALDVPAGPAPTEARVPPDRPLGDRLPEGEVAGVLLRVVVGVDAAAGAGHQPGGGDPGERPVAGEAGDPEVDAALPAIGDAGRLQPLDESDHLRDVGGRPWVVMGAADPQGVDVGEEALDPGGGLLIEPVTVLAGVVDQTIVHVGEVHHVGHPLEPPFQPAAQHILEKEGAEVADVGAVPHRRAAGVEAHVARLEGLDGLEPPGEGVVEAECHGRSRISAGARGRADPLG